MLSAIMLPLPTWPKQGHTIICICNRVFFYICLIRAICCGRRWACPSGNQCFHQHRTTWASRGTIPYSWTSHFGTCKVNWHTTWGCRKIFRRQPTKPLPRSILGTTPPLTLALPLAFNYHGHHDHHHPLAFNPTSVSMFYHACRGG